MRISLLWWLFVIVSTQAFSITRSRSINNNNNNNNNIQFKSTTTTNTLLSSTTTDEDVATTTESLPLVGRTIAVAGATGRTGSLVVRELVERGANVVALVRTMDRAQDVLSDLLPNDKKKNDDDDDEEEAKVIAKVCNLGNEMDIQNAVENCDSAIWCATGFSDAPGPSILQKIKRLAGVALAPKRSIDAIGIPALANAMSSSNNNNNNRNETLPHLVMLSSAGVTRPSWDDTKKEKYNSCADIPIVRLNPFGILDVKRESEEKLRQSGVNYCIFRPCGLNDKWPANSRPIFSQGDVAVGRINRKDVASLLVDCLSEPHATGKTFEALSLAGYPSASSISNALSKLQLDDDGIEENENVLWATYSAMMQLIPGEKQDPSSLAMGQSYEQLDQNQVGRLGKRGEEDAEAAAPKPSS